MKMKWRSIAMGQMLPQGASAGIVISDEYATETDIWNDAGQNSG
ncbi:MAG: hypothetical protein M0Z76_03275 [Gammaproteobacteria bacterium]|nr:hypothetical protein [Gammaproteobacteria bacterium]